MNVLTVEALCARLDRSVSLLSRGDRTVQPRHQTLRALIDWSYDLLAPAERWLFGRLSVFVGGCDLAAVAAVCADDVSEDETLALLASLVEKSLVVADVADREPRYRLLEVTRPYAREKLADRNETALTARRHAIEYTRLADRLERGDGCSCDATRPRALLDIENWRAALEWTLTGRNDVQLGQRLVAALRTVWSYVSLIEGRRWLLAATALIDQQTPEPVKAALEFTQSSIASGLGEWESALAAARRALVRYQELGDPSGLANAQLMAGAALICLMRAEEGEPLVREALESARALGDGKLIGNALENIAYARSMAGDLAQARGCIAEASAVREVTGNRSGVANAQLVLAEAEFRAGNVDRACALVEPCVVMLRELRATRLLTPALLNWAAYLIACDRWDQARSAAQEALTLARETQRTIWPAWALQHLAAVAALAPDGAGSGERTREQAAQLLGHVDARVAATASEREFTEQREYDRTCAALRATVGAERYVWLTAAGASLTEQQALELAAAIWS
jgi:non-specific serine/threonine protein kinase